jgi:hypothetical protein
VGETSPEVVFEPRHEPQKALVRWEPDSLVLSIVFVTVAGLNRSNLREDIDRQLGIRAPERRIVLGDLDVLLDPSGHIKAMEIRTNPRYWQRASLPPLSGAASPVHAQLRAAYDANGVASFPDEVEIALDPKTHTVRCRFKARDVSQWGALTDNIIVGVDADGRWSELRVADDALPIE